jgi:putative selenium metabolism protein SsnA
MLITNTNLITWEDPNRILENHAIYIENDLIKEIGPQAEMVISHPDTKQLDARGQYVIPGNICAHTHYYGAFARGMAIPGAAPGDFPEILGKLWWPLDKALTEEDIRYSALVCLVDALKHGTTSLVDHHASPNTIPGSLDIVAQAVDESGLRSVLCYEVTDRDGEAKARAGIAENVRFIARARHERIAGGRVSANFGLHASLTLSDATLDLCREALPELTGFHIHAAESDADQYDSLAKSGLRVIDRLDKHGILGPRTIVAHAVHVDAREISLLAQSGTWVSHQPRSNMNNAVGVAPVESMLRAGVKVCLGNDGLSNTMWKEWEAAYLVHKIWNRDPRRMPASVVARMAVVNNSRLMSVFFPDVPIGVVQPGAAADLIFVDYHPTTPMHTGNLPWHIIFGFNESMVTTTIVAGKVLMRDRQLLTMDEAAITARSRELAVQAWKRYEDNVARFPS